MFITALFTLVKIQKQPQCLSVDDKEDVLGVPIVAQQETNVTRNHDRKSLTHTLNKSINYYQLVPKHQLKL